MLKKTEKFITDIKKLPEHHKHIILWLSFIIIFGAILTIWIISFGEKLVLNNDGFNVFTAGSIKEKVEEITTNKDLQLQENGFIGFPNNY